MASTIGAEIEFLSEEEACVSLYRNASDQFDEKECELFLVILTILRTITNFGNDAVSEIKLGELLSHQMVSYRNSIEDIVRDNSEGRIKLLKDHPGFEPKKSFSVHLDYPRLDFEYKMHGFGLFGKGVGYYAPMAVNLLIKKIAETRFDDKDFIKLLESAVVCSGIYGLSGRVPIVNQTLHANSLVQTILIPGFDLDDFLDGDQEDSKE